MSTGFIWLSIGAPLYGQSDAVRPWYCNSYTEGFTGTWRVQLLSATGSIEYCAVSVWLSDGQTTQRDQRCGDVIDEISFREYPQLKPPGHCLCAACSGTFISITVFGLELDW